MRKIILFDVIAKTNPNRKEKIKCIVHYCLSVDPTSIGVSVKLRDNNFMYEFGM
jgi:hypothetical protein